MESHVLDLIHTITFLDVIDILVVAYFLNKLYQMLKTHGRRPLSRAF